MLVKDVMTTDVHVVSPNDHLETAARLMLKHKVGGIPVVKEGKLKGLITESDIFRAIWGILSNRTSYRILFFEKGGELNRSPNDYIEMCLKHHCRIHTFITYPKPDDGYMQYLCIEGDGGDDFIKDLWSHSCEIIIVERDHKSTITKL